MNISAAAVKALRDRTNQPMMDCKAALIEAKGDNDKAVEILRKKSKDVQDKKVSREMAEGRIAAYVDAAQKVGALLEMRCESAPVAKSDQFAQLANDVAKQIALKSPAMRKPANLVDKIAEGKMKTWFAENVLLEQPFVKDDSKTVGDLLKAAGLNLVKFVRFKVGELS